MGRFSVEPIEYYKVVDTEVWVKENPDDPSSRLIRRPTVVGVHETVDHAQRHVRELEKALRKEEEERAQRAAQAAAEAQTPPGSEEIAIPE